MASLSRTALVIQHEVDGPVGLIGDNLVERGYELHVVQVLGRGSSTSDVALPDPTGFDLVVPLGSVHSVYDVDTIGTWIHREVSMLRIAIEAGVPILGICFGGQALAQALGGHVEKAAVAEIGWVEIDTTDADAVPAGPWFTWHLDRFVLPAEAQPLAHTAVATQAFRSGSAVGLQFHPEVDLARVRYWVDHCPADYFAALEIDPQPMLDAFTVNAPRAAINRQRLVDWFLDEVVA